MSMTETDTSLLVGDPQAPPVDEPGGLDTVQTLQRATQDASTQMEGLIAQAAAENRDLTEDEADLLAKLKESHDTASSQLATLTDLHERSLANAQAFETLKMKPAAPVLPRQTVPYGEGVTHEPDMYLPSLERGSEDPDFLRDVLIATGGATVAGDAAAAGERLRRHQTYEHKRDNTTAGYPGFVVPRYAGVGAINEAAVAGRPVANAIGSMPLPRNKEIRIPTETTTPSAAVQATQHATVSETDQVTSEEVLPVVTIAGQQQVSFQAVDLGSGVDQFIFRSLARQVATNLDKQIMVGTGQNGQLSGLSLATGVIASGNLIDKDQSSPQAHHVYQQLMALGQKVQVARFAGPDMFIMHPRRWWFLAGGIDGDNRPTFQAMTSTAVNVVMDGGSSTAPMYGNTGANVQGVPVVTTGHIATNSGAGSEDYVFALNRDDYALYESPVQTVQAYADGGAANAVTTGANTLTHTLVMYKYIAGALVNDKGAARLEGTVVSTTL